MHMEPSELVHAGQEFWGKLCDKYPSFDSRDLISSLGMLLGCCRKGKATKHVTIMLRTRKASSECVYWKWSGAESVSCRGLPVGPTESALPSGKADACR